MCAGDFQATPTKFTERAKSIDTLNYVRQVRMEKGKKKNLNKLAVSAKQTITWGLASFLGKTC